MEKPAKCITVEKARELQKEWKNTRGRAIENSQRYEDTWEFFYTVDELQEYLEFVKEKSLEQGVEKPGIRIYFGAYPNGGPKRSYSTVFLSPTIGASGSLEAAEDFELNNYTIEPLNSVTGGYPPKEY